MQKHIVTRTERNILSSLKRWHPTVPPEVLAAEARYRLEQSVLKDNEGGEIQPDIAERLGYSLSQVEQIVRTAKLARKAGTFPPLAVWLAKWRVEVETAHLRDDEDEAAGPKMKASEEDDTDDDTDDDASTVAKKGGPAPVYAVTPYTHYQVEDDEFLVVDNAPWLRPGAQLSFMTGGLLSQRPRRCSVLTVQRLIGSGCLSLQVGNPNPHAA